MWMKGKDSIYWKCTTPLALIDGLDVTAAETAQKPKVVHIHTATIFNYCNTFQTAVYIEIMSTEIWSANPLQCLL